MDDFKAAQQALTDAIVNPSLGNELGVEQRRLKIYQELIFNNIEGFCSNAFPVLKSIVEPSLWNSYVRAFLITGDKISPYFVDIAEQFLNFITQTQTQTQLTLLPQYLLELAHYEWVELNVSLQENEMTGKDWQVDSNLLVPNSTWAIGYQYPVHTISKQMLQSAGQTGKPEQASECEPSDTFLIVYQDAEGDVAFMTTNAITAHLVNYIDEYGVNAREGSAESLTSLSALENYFKQLQPDTDNKVITNFLTAAINDFVQRGVLVVD